MVIIAKAYYYYLDLENLGPIIEGDLVIQGTVLDEEIGPALCTISAAISENDDYQELQAIFPTKMIITPAEDENELTKFLIPIHLENQHITHGLRVNIYIQNRSLIKYDDDAEEDSQYAPDNRGGLTLACSFAPSITAPSVGAISGDDQRAQESVPPSLSANDSPFFEETDAEELILRNVKIATDFDDVISLQQEGYHLICSQLDSSGRVLVDQDHMWKFHVLGDYGSAKQPGVEDILWIKCLKSLGTLPSVPFYHIMHDYDLSHPEDDVRITIVIMFFTNLFSLCGIVRSIPCISV